MACTTTSSFTGEELKRIGNSADAGTMSVLKTDIPEDSLNLREISQPLTPEDLQTEAYKVLKARMLATVNDPENPGVGIAAPQVGIKKRLIAVERHDRKIPVFEFYVNPKIEQYGADSAPGGEGCLSVPDRSEEVCRSQQIRISYLNESTGKYVEETVEGFTAVIFQHEIDHLNGILYIDRYDEQAGLAEQSAER